jgi:WD40 repeat protein
MKYDCYFTIEASAASDASPTPWWPGIRVQPCPQDSSLEQALAHLRPQIKGFQVFRSPDNPAVVHVVASQWAGQVHYSLEKRVSINYAGKLRGLVDDLGRQLNGCIHSKYIFMWGSEMVEDSTTRVKVAAQQEVVRRVLTDWVPLAGYDRILWVAETARAGDKLDTTVQYRGPEKYPTGPPGIALKLKVDANNDFAWGEFAYHIYVVNWKINPFDANLAHSARAFIPMQMKRPYPVQVRWAMLFLGQCQSEAAIPVLLQYLDYRYTTCRVWEEAYPALRALEQLGQPAAVAAFQALDQERNPLRAQLLCRVLRHIEGQAQTTRRVATVIAQAHDEQHRQRLRAALVQSAQDYPLAAAQPPESFARRYAHPPPESPPIENRVQPGEPQAPLGQVDAWGDRMPRHALARLGTTRLRPGDAVTAVAYAPDGKRLASGSRDHTISLWDAAVGREIRRYCGHQGSVTALVFTPDGRMLISGSEDRTIRFWQVATGKPAGPVLDQDMPIADLAVTPDGKTVASVTTAGAIRLWEVATGKQQRQLPGPEQTRQSLSFSPNGRLLASACKDHPVRLWDVAQGQLQPPLQPAHQARDTVAFAPDGKRLATGCQKAQFCLWDLSSGSGPRLRGDGRSGEHLVFSPDGKILAAGLGSSWELWDVTPRPGTNPFQVIARWSLTLIRYLSLFVGEPRNLIPCFHEFLFSLYGKDATDKPRHVLESPNHSLSKAAFSPDSTRIALGSGLRLCVWDTASGQECLQTGSPDQAILSVALTADGQTAATASTDGIRVWEAATGRMLYWFEGQRNARDSFAIAFSPDGKLIAVGGSNSGRGSLEDDAIGLCDRATGKEVRQLAGHISTVTCLGFSADGKLLASSSRDRTIRLWDVATGKLRQRLVYEHAVDFLALAPDGQTVAAGCTEQNVIVVCKVATGQRLRELPHRQPVRCAAFSPDGVWLATSSADQGVHLWNTVTGHERSPVLGPQDSARAVAFSPDGKTLASAGRDHTIHLWEVASGQERQQFRGHRGDVTSLAFSADGQRLISGSADTTALVWDVTGRRQARSE